MTDAIMGESATNLSTEQLEAQLPKPQSLESSIRKLRKAISRAKQDFIEAVTRFNLDPPLLQPGRPAEITLKLNYIQLSLLHVPAKT
ncbi:hypothetical protein Nepgr_006749 [Nepenthes gracilis]|uniref:Uncharacterized protein n=1 Tax=Nepenthes gracilis TaxID=150966 RepID=A0AAD3S5M8_NEPGR|nr:hypothetical protein Nepgr_006749 [Nepenthes gracilis]